MHEVRVERARISSILQAAQRNDQPVRLPVGIPNAIPNRVWRKKKTYGLAYVAGLTAQKDPAVREKTGKQAATKTVKS